MRAEDFWCVVNKGGCCLDSLNGDDTRLAAKQTVNLSSYDIVGSSPSIPITIRRDSQVVRHKVATLVARVQIPLAS